MPTDQMSPVPGKWVDPPPKQTAETVVAIENRTRIGAVVYLTILRFNAARGTLLAGGATYYAFVATFSILALIFAGVAYLGADDIVTWVDEVIDRYLPQLISSDGLNPETLRSAGQSAGWIGALFFLYSGTGVVNALSAGIHIINGAPKDPRNYAWKKIRQLGWLFMLLLLLAISVTPLFVLSAVGEPIREFFGVESTPNLAHVVSVVGYGLTLVINFFSIYLIFNFLGGVRPERYAIVVGAIFGAISTLVLRAAMVYILTWAVERPQYGAFAVPVAMLLSYYLQWLVTFFAAALCAAVALYRGGIVEKVAEREEERQQGHSVAAAEKTDEPEFRTQILEPDEVDEWGRASHATEVVFEDEPDTVAGSSSGSTETEKIVRRPH